MPKIHKPRAGSSHEAVPRRLSDAMERQIREARADERPAFFYHLGDVVYHHGKSTKYREQFYKPFKFYPAPIFAISGNHDLDCAEKPVIRLLMANYW